MIQQLDGSIFGYVYLVVLMACHHHEADVRGRQRALEKGNALATRQSYTGLVR